jgi:hypothetical protein
MSCARCKRTDVAVGLWESPPFAGQQLCAECKVAVTLEYKQRRDIVLRTLVKHAPDEMNEAGFGKHRCVLATRVAVEVLRRFQIQAEPIIVDVMAANASWLRVAKNPDATEADFLATDAHMVRMRTTPEEGDNRFPAHLVAYLPEESSILDLDMQQFIRPGIRAARAASLLVPEGFLRGKHAEYDLPDGGAIMYAVLNDGVERNYADGVDWKLKGAWFPLVRNLTLRVEAALKK